MKKNKLKLISIFLITTISLFTSLYAEDSNSSYTSSDDVKKAQIAMSTNEYIVTAGDIYSLSYSAGSFNVSVDSTYKVRVANLGIIDVRGLTIQQLKAKVEALIIDNYPTAVVQIFLANPASFQVFVKGEVNNASTTTTWALGKASEIMSEYYTNYSSRRFFTIVSENGQSRDYDLFKATRYGDRSQDPYLRPGDTIIVKKIDRSVTIQGEVLRPGTYELLPGEEIKSLIFDYGNGFSPYADKDNITVSRFVGGHDYYDISYIKESDLHVDIPLACYDKITVSSYLLYRSVIRVEGAVRGDYNYQTEANSTAQVISNSVVTSPQAMTQITIPYNKGTSCKAFILENKRMFTNSSDLANCYISRKDENGNETRLSINVNNIIFPAKQDLIIDDIMLQADDILVVPFTQYFVNVNGAVNAGGKYAYQPGKDWTYYVGLANGFNLDQNLFGTIKITDKNGKRLSKKSEIPPEATIYASRNSPNNGWLIPLITAIMSFITGCLTFYGTVKSFQP